VALPGATAVDWLHLRFRMHGRGLEQGVEKWQTGRFIIEWHSPGAFSAAELDPIAGVRDDDLSASTGIVAKPADGPAVPALRLEHLGKAGEMVVSEMEILPVRERAAWKYGRLLLAAGFLGWLYLCTRIRPPASRVRRLLAASLWLGMCLHFVIPGPWKIQQSLHGGFRLGNTTTERSMEAAVSSTPLEIDSGAVVASGRLQTQGSLALRVKNLFVLMRPVLHMLLLLAPTLASAWLIGPRATLALAAMFTISVEASQLAFGYGFDWIDVTDLATDAAGIALGLWLAVWIPRRVESTERLSFLHGLCRQVAR
jgi:hypothetical protein